jgi:hypothetical protein
MYCRGYNGQARRKKQNGGNHTLLSVKNKSDQHLLGVGLTK